MHTVLALAVLLCGSALAQSLTTDVSLTTSILLLPDQSGTMEASVINVVGNGTILGLSCPDASLVPRRVKRAASSPDSSDAIGQCAYTEMDDPTMTITEGVSGTATTLDIATVIVEDSINGNPSSQTTVDVSSSGSLHCHFLGTTAAACTEFQNAALTVEAPDATSKSSAARSETEPFTTTLGPDVISWVQIVITAGQQKLLSASPTLSSTSNSTTNGAFSTSGGASSSLGSMSSGGTSSTSKGAPSSTESAPPKSTSNVAGDNVAGVGITGAILAGVMGFFMAI
ncbi:MAG: hypothetical protein Q9157_002959 [Trypethelium eluteriae]